MEQVHSMSPGSGGADDMADAGTPFIHDAWYVIAAAD